PSVYDAAAQLTADVKKDLRDSWKVWGSDKKGNGVALMTTLFADNQETIGYFKRLGDVSQGMANDKLRGHSITLMYALQNFIDQLDNPDDLVCVVEKFAVNHITRKISAAEFGKINGPIKKVLASKNFGDKYANAWAKLVAVVQAAL
uniref:Globin-1 n=1 Tax=Anadara inaequivalvis TaxID=2784303 RepID=UPI0001753FBC|nr:Chain A, Globin-1 [Anadara inaequivalvis]2R4Z_B Chain B, Globin-1 [Anadara inaequivalvis]2Z8A_A Chain A, Globin-1 [Anadara inaequivalvis]2Z8A_B Chain B, Globin-1 [Anadara inaequivalvis]